MTSPEVALPLPGTEDVRRLGRLLTQIENDDPAARPALAAAFEASGAARTVGFTGPPGVGKSSVVCAVVEELLDQDLKVAVLAVDPSSPFTGGAVLGDRVRMSELQTRAGVFIRSMATRGAVGGLAQASRAAIDVLDAAGFDWVIVETVGVGQDEIDVARATDSVVVVSAPGLGDGVQAIKAGTLEIADLFVVNKADRPGATSAVRDLETMLSMRDTWTWKPPVLATVALKSEGIRELLSQLDRHREHLLETGELEERRRRQLRLRVELELRRRLARLVEDQFASLPVEAPESADVDRIVERLARRMSDSG